MCTVNVLLELAWEKGARMQTSIGEEHTILHRGNFEKLFSVFAKCSNGFFTSGEVHLLSSRNFSFAHFGLLLVNIVKYEWKILHNFRDISLNKKIVATLYDVYSRQSFEK